MKTFGDQPSGPPAAGSDPADTEEVSALSWRPHLSYFGGRVLANASVVVVFWGPNTNSDVKARIGGFYAGMLGGGYTDWLTEYNTAGVTPVDGMPGSNQVIGKGSLQAVVTITPTTTLTTLTDGDIAAELETQIRSGALPAPDANTIYMMYFPNTVSMPNFCQPPPAGFCAYHGTFTRQGLSEIVYAVMPDLSSGCGRCGPGPGFDNTTMASSHELIEALTDTEAGLVSGVERPDAWRDPNSIFNEIGDICNQEQACVGEFIVQNQWSNSRNACFAPRVVAPAFAGADLISSAGSITVRTSTGSHFACNETWTTSLVGTQGTFFADVTGDGRADGIAVNNTFITVRRSTGTTFGPDEAWTSDPFFGNKATLVADITGDGKADVIAVNTTGIVVRPSITVGFGGNQTFSTTPFFGDVATVVADVTGDGRADAIAVNSTGINVRRSSGQVLGPITEKWSTTPFTGDLGTFFADVTGDGKVDAIAVIQGQGVVVRRSTGKGFGPAEVWASSSPFSGSITTLFADVTGDGRADEIMVGSNGVFVRRVNSTATAFGDPEFWTTLFTGVNGIFAANVDSPVTVQRPTWTPIGGLGTSIASGWVLGNVADANGNFSIYRWDPSAQNWPQVTGGAERISVDLNGNPWVVNTAGQIYKWNGSAFVPFGGSFCAQSVASGTNDNETWATRCGDLAVFHWNGTSWHGDPFGALANKIALFSTPDPNCGDHLPVLIGTDTNIYFYKHTDCASGSFTFSVENGQGLDITTDFAVGFDGNVYRWDTNVPGWDFYIAGPFAMDTRIGGWWNGLFAMSASTGALQLLSGH